MVIARFLVLCLATTALSGAEPDSFSYRGYLENRSLFYPREAVNDRAQLVNESFLRFETAVRLPGNFRLFAGLDAQSDTHHQVERSVRLSWDDRSLQRPAFAIRTLGVQYSRGPLRLTVGKQVVRWGVMSLFSPTDRFVPRDYLSPSGSDYLGVYAARAVFDTGPHSVELLYLPRFTPSRLPLINQRWVITPPEIPTSWFREAEIRYPGGPQFGVRYHGIRSSIEYSLSAAEGFYHFPSLPYRLDWLAGVIEYRRVFPKFHMFGADLTAAWRGLLLKAESSYETSPSEYADDVWTYATEVEKLFQDWQVTCGYMGEYVTEDRGAISLNINRALRNAFTGRVAYAPPASAQVISADWYLRPSPAAWIARLQYSRRLTPALRLTAAWNWIRGEKGTTLGRYGRNSYFSLHFRYSF